MLQRNRTNHVNSSYFGVFVGTALVGGRGPEPISCTDSLPRPVTNRAARPLFSVSPQLWNKGTTSGALSDRRSTTATPPALRPDTISPPPRNLFRHREGVRPSSSRETGGGGPKRRHLLKLALAKVPYRTNRYVPGFFLLLSDRNKVSRMEGIVGSGIQARSLE